jgi:hypothetical protein
VCSSDLLVRTDVTAAVGDRLGEALVPLLEGRSGRVLIGNDRAGATIKHLRDAGIDAYGCDPDAEEGLAIDLRRSDLLTQLEELEDRRLDAVVITGQEARLTPTGAARTCELAVRRVTRNGRVVVTAETPEMWSERVGPVAADLLSGRVFRGETWLHLLELAGAEIIASNLTPRGTLIVARRPG